MASITGFGGMFLRANDSKALYQWYVRHLGLVKSGGAFAFPVPTQHPEVIFSLFKQDNAYFPPAQKAMVNLQVDDLDGLLDRLIEEGVTVDPKRESYDFGKFGWIADLEGIASSSGSPSPPIDVRWPRTLNKRWLNLMDRPERPRRVRTAASSELAKSEWRAVASQPSAPPANLRN